MFAKLRSNVFIDALTLELIDPFQSSDDALRPYIHDSRTEVTGTLDVGRRARTFYYEDGTSVEMSEAELIRQWRSQKGVMERVIEGKKGDVTSEPGP